MNIYVGHPFSMKEENKRETEEIIAKLVKESPEHTYFSPIHSFGFLYDKVDYQTGIEMCFKLLKMCDIMYVYGDWENSRGCKAEIKFCEENGIPYKIIAEKELHSCFDCEGCFCEEYCRDILKE